MDDYIMNDRNVMGYHGIEKNKNITWGLRPEITSMGKPWFV